jgi:hypothetical protein
MINLPTKAKGYGWLIVEHPERKSHNTISVGLGLN